MCDNGYWGAATCDGDGSRLSACSCALPPAEEGSSSVMTALVSSRRGVTALVLAGMLCGAICAILPLYRRVRELRGHGFVK